MDDLHEFDGDLRRFGNGATRPFLCKGSPFGCEIFLVGINPGTDTPFWPCWSVESGCDKEGWLKAYLKTHHRFSSTRERIERLCDAIERHRPCVRCRPLETNIWPYYSRRASDLPKEKRITKVFEFLLERLKPRIVFVHGKPAIKHLEKLTLSKINRDVFTPVCYNGIAFDVWARHHLSFQCSYAEVEELGRKLKDRCLQSVQMRQ